MQPFRDTVLSVDVSSSRPEILGGSVDGTVRVFDVRGGAVTTDELGAPVVCARFSGDGALVLAACADGAVRCADRRTGEVLGAYTGHASGGTKTDCAWTAQDAFLCCGGEDGRVTYWDVMGGGDGTDGAGGGGAGGGGAGAPVKAFRAHDLAVTALDVRRDGAAVVTAGADGAAWAWTVDGEPVGG